MRTIIVTGLLAAALLAAVLGSIGAHDPIWVSDGKQVGKPLQQNSPALPAPGKGV